MKFWNFMKNEGSDDFSLRIDGPIDEETWWGDEVTPKQFGKELAEANGNLTVWINSPGGDVFAATQIYNMLKNHAHKVTVKVDSLAASAASVIAMAGDQVLISPGGMFMIHNPSTVAFGEKSDMEQAISVLDEVKESIINAYQLKTGLSRNKISGLMDDETWMNAKKAVQLGFADGMLFADGQAAEAGEDTEAVAYSGLKIMNSLADKVRAKALADKLKNDSLEAAAEETERQKAMEARKQSIINDLWKYGV